MKKFVVAAVLVLSISGATNAAEIWVGTGQTHSDIKSAITASVNGDTIIVKDGTYAGPNNTMLHFTGKTITLKSENGPQNCIINCESASHSSAFIFSMTGEPAAAVVDGFTIINATNNAININGGWDGLTCPTIKNCIINNNSAYLGAGLCCIDTTSLITGCTFSQNSAALGAAISIGGANNPRIENCVISNNTATENGGGIYCDPYMSPIIKNCLLTGNSAAQKAGAIFCSYGANPLITNCTIAYNTAGTNGGGGIYCYSDYSSSTIPTVTNCTISHNTNFGIYEDGANADPIVTYCHFYNNSDADFRDYDSWQWSGAFDINMNIDNAQNNIDGDPLFVTGPLTDYYLSQVTSGQLAQSPCVDAGSDTASNLGIDNMTTRTDGTYDTGTVDIGYHHPNPPVLLYQLASGIVGGNGSLLPESGSFAVNLVVELTAAPDLGYRVRQWTGTDNDALKTTVNQVTMNSNKTVTVEFEVIPSIIYVDDDGPGAPAEDGSPANPYDSMQEAVDMVPANGIVVVLDGTYTGAGNNMIDFNGKDLIIRSQNGPQNCIIDCEFGSQAFYLENYETNNSVIQGFTITRGYAYQGGAVYLSYSSPTIKNCIMTGNQAYGANTGGGAIHCLASSPLIDNCVFTKNSAYHFGGAIEARLSSSPTISNSVFIENSANNAGGGIYISLSFGTIRNCRFTANKSVTAGGAIYSTNESFCSVINCTMNENTTNGLGGGIYCYDSSPLIINSIFTGNGNNAVFEGHSASDPNVMHCLFYDNPAGDYYDNDTSTSYTGAVSINTNIPQASNNIDDDPLFASEGFLSDNGTPENTEDDFWVDGDYHLKAQNGRWNPSTEQWLKDASTSPCIDAGDTNSNWKKELWPHGKRINIGFYGGTNQASMSDSTIGSPADIDNNDRVDGQDLESFVYSWLVEDVLLPADMTRNGSVDMVDFAAFAKDWGQSI
ncbi:MAG: right-handed parallel beta-helix repeat-containing protein [Phycisphaerae bacterium]|nr:right-handed parallel beta-helix repeat-containing protein [Phycisphaerae bacterium]